MVERQEAEDGLDRRLRAALEPQGEQVARVAGEALRGAQAGRRRRLGPVAWVGAGLTALVLAGILLLPALRDRGPSATVVASRYSVSNRNGLVVVRSLDGGATFLRSGERPSEPPRGMMLIVRGETRP